MRRHITFVTLLSLGLMTACVGSARTASSEVPVDRACAGLSDADVDAVMEQVRANVESVGTLREDRGPKLPPHLAGAIVQVRATPGMTSPWLGRVLECHAARHSVGPCSSNESCPLALADVHIDVTTTRTGFAVAIRSHDADVAAEIARRATSLERSARGKAPQTMVSAR